MDKRCLGSLVVGFRLGHGLSVLHSSKRLSWLDGVSRYLGSHLIFVICLKGCLFWGIVWRQPLISWAFWIAPSNALARCFLIIGVEIPSPSFLFRSGYLLQVDLGSSCGEFGLLVSFPRSLGLWSYVEGVSWQARLVFPLERGCKATIGCCYRPDT